MQSYRTLNRARRLSRVAATSVAAGLLIASGAGLASAQQRAGVAHSSALTTVNIGIALSPPKMIFMGPYVAQAEGFFTKEGIKPKFISMPNGLQTELGTTAGTINFGFSSSTDAIESAAAGAPIHAVGSYGTTLDTECIAAPGIRDAKQLVGKPVGSTGTDGFSYTTLAACLSPGGVSMSQVNPITMTRSEFVPALETGRIKVAVFHADDAYVVLHQLKGASVLEREYEVLPRWWYGGITVLDRYAESHVSLTEHFLAALVMADRWMNNPSNLNALVALGVKETSEDRGAVAYAAHFLQAAHAWPNGLGLSAPAEQYTAEQLYKLKEISKVPSYNQVVDPSYMEAALAMVGQG